MRKKIIRDKVDYNTLHAMYLDKALPVNEIARRINRTRVRVWQLLKEYNLHDRNRKQVASVCAFCHSSFNATLSVVNNGGGKYCNETCYHEHQRSISNFQDNRHGKRIARKNIETWLGKPLPEGFVVHHEDGDCLSNDLRNLFIFPSHSEHLKYHHAKRHGTAVLPYKELWELPEMIRGWKT